MTWAPLLLALLATTGSAPVAAAAADTVSASDAYLDAGAAELVRRARQRRATMEASIRRYRTEVRDAASAGVTLGWRERTLALCESAHRIDWDRDGAVRVEVLGARAASPALSPEPRVPGGTFPCGPTRGRSGRDGDRRWRATRTGTVFDPAEDHLLLHNILDDESGFIRHPLAPGSEAHYRFRSGDTTTIRLPDGRDVRILELVVQPRRRDYRLVSGSLWIEAEDHALVRATYRLARPFDAEIDVDRSDGDFRLFPGFLKPIRAEFRYVTMEYGLWEMRWWMPRLVAFEGQLRMGALRFPARYERLYSAYEVEGDPEASTPADPAAQAAARAAADDDPRPVCPVSHCVCTARVCRPLEVVRPDEPDALLTSEHLPPPRVPEERLLIDPAELEPLLAGLARLPPPPWTVGRPRVHWGLGRHRLTRYNRIEGLSVGGRAEMDLGRVVADATARIGTGDRRPGLELGVDLSRPAFRYRIAAYHGLAAVDSAAAPFGLGNSLAALVLGRDHGDYYRATGLSLSGARTVSHPVWFAWRLYAERQRPAHATTEFSLRRLRDSEHVFRENPPADSAGQVGLTLRVGAARGRDPASFRWDAEVGAEAAAGSFDFLKGDTRLRVGSPLPAGLAASLEGAFGAASTSTPPQALWTLGGPSTLRGYPPGTDRGPAFWRARLELARHRPAARAILFADAARVGTLGELGRGRPFLAAGAGLGFFDGIARIDLARPIRAENGRWRLHLYLDGAL